MGKLLLAMDALLTRNKWAGNNPEKVRELSKNIRRKRGIQSKYNQREVDFEVCGCKVKKCN